LKSDEAKGGAPVCDTREAQRRDKRETRDGETRQGKIDKRGREKD